MNGPTGFVERWMADLVGMEYEPFTLNDGSEAAMVDSATFDLAYRTMMTIYEKLINENGARVCNESITRLPMIECISSDIHGMNVLLHMFYKSDSTLDGLTSGATKDDRHYQAIKNVGVASSRFNFENFDTLFNDVWNGRTPQIDVDIEDHAGRGAALPRRRPDVDGDEEIIENISEEEAPVKEVPPASPETIKDKIIDEFTNRSHLYNISQIHSSEDCWVFGSNTSDYDEKFFNELQEMSRKFNKIVVITNTDTITARLKNTMNDSEIEENLIIVISSVENISNSFVMVDISGMNKPICFGDSVSNLYVVKGVDINKKINRIRKNSDISKEDREKEIRRLIDKRENSPYAKYDRIFKDTMTNVVFALKDRHIFYSLIHLSTNKSFAWKVLHEISRRIDDIPVDELKKIDKNYQEDRANQQRDSYIKFAVDNTSTVIKELKVMYEKAKEKFQDHMDKAMESGKMMKKYMDQIDSFNHDDHILKEREKAQNEYDEVLALDKISAIYIEGETINVYTENLYAKDDRSGKFHDMGTFHIQIGMNSNKYDTGNTVRIRNTKHQIRGYDGGSMNAPHVFRNGTICHGNLSNGMVNAYAKRDFYQLVLQLILFLQSANTDDAAGKYVDKWPEVPEEVTRSLPTVEVIEEAEPVDDGFNDSFADAIPVAVAAD